MSGLTTSVAGTLLLRTSAVPAQVTLVAAIVTGGVTLGGAFAGLVRGITAYDLCVSSAFENIDRSQVGKFSMNKDMLYMSIAPEPGGPKSGLVSLGVLYSPKLPFV